MGNWDLSQIFEAAAQNRRERERLAFAQDQQRRQDEMQARQESRDAERFKTDQQAREEALWRSKLEARAGEKYAAGDPHMLQAVNPEAYSRIEANKTQLEGARLDVAAKQQASEEQRAQETARFQAMAAQTLAQNPQAAPFLQRVAAERARQGLMNGVQLPGYALPDGMAGPQRQPTQQEIGQLQAEANIGLPTQRPHDIKTTENMADFIGISGMVPGQTAFGPAYEKYLVNLRAQQERANRDKSDPTGDLRKEFQGQAGYKDAQTVAAAWEKINNTSASPAGDMSLIYGFMKLQDPNSSVREGEYATAQNSGSIPQSVVAMYNKLVEGKGLLTEQQRTGLKSEAAQVFASQRKRYDALASQYKRLAKGRGVAPDDVVLDPGFGGASPQQKQASITRTDPSTGETRTWDGSAWVRQ